MKNLNCRSETKTLEEKCEILDIWDVLGRRWSLLILKNLSIKKVVR
jgi:DNA-binding HxlR family transcriptional regulator